MVIGYVKRTASRKTEQSKLRWKDENSSLNSRSFKELLVNIRLETSSSPGYTNKRRTSYVYHVQFPHIFQFLGGDCIFFFFHGFSPSPSLSQKLQVCFHLLCCIFSITFVRSFVNFNKCRHFFVVQTTLLQKLDLFKLTIWPLFRHFLQKTMHFLLFATFVRY